MVDARFEPESSTFVLKVRETAKLWPEESTRSCTPVVCPDHVEPMQWLHLNVFKKECVIVLARFRKAHTTDHESDNKRITRKPSDGGRRFLKT